ncbi:MAG: ComEC/Rec2 family competence protein [candidate division Zixibacteria bacterium]|nr:ComEC/Rec2 family competence protein [candidate division Zixibacteria bacterium]
MVRKIPAVAALLVVVLSIAVADKYALPPGLLMIILLGSLLPAILFYLRKAFCPAGFFALLCIGAFAAFNHTSQVKTFPSGHVVYCVDNDRKYQVFGRVDDWPETKDNRTNLCIKVDSLRLDNFTRNSSGRILANIRGETTRFQYGDQISFEAELHSVKGGMNPSGFNYRRYLNLRGTFGVAYLSLRDSIWIKPDASRLVSRTIESLRSGILSIFNKTLDPEAAALESGFLIGETRNISPKIYRFFRDSGTLHLLAVSGSNVALVVLFFSFLFRTTLLRRSLRTFLLILIIFIFSNLAHNQPSVVRAALMAALLLLGQFLQRRIEFNNIIACAALLILLINPGALFDIGFQLSFVTAWGLIVFLPRLSDLWGKWINRRWIKYLVWPPLVCLVAQLVSMPLSAFYFHRLPLISFVANMVIVPLVTICTIGGVFLLAAAFLLPPAGFLAGAVLNQIISLTSSSLQLFGSFESIPTGNFPISGWTLLIYYAFILLLAAALTSRRGRMALILYLPVVVIVFLLTGIGTQKKLERFTIFSVSGGFIMAHQCEHPQIVFSRLPFRGYDYSEKVILPFMYNTGLKSADLVALSVGYQTIREISTLLGQGAAKKIYLPATARNTFLDICSAGGIAYDTLVLVFTDSLSFINDTLNNSSLIENNILVYDMGVSRLILLGEERGISRAAEFLEGGHEITLVKPMFSEADLRFITDAKCPGLKHLIFNKMSKEALLLHGELESKFGDSLYLIETSKVGAVEMLYENGRLRIAD